MSSLAKPHMRPTRENQKSFDAIRCPQILELCKSGKPRKTGESALCTVDDTCCFHDIRLRPKTSVYHMKVIVVSTASGCDVTNCATTLQGFNKHASSRREVCQIREASLVALRNFPKIYACSHVSIIRLVQSTIPVSSDSHSRVPLAR